MRIGFFTDAYFPQVNGVVTSVHQTAEELRRRGHTVYIVTSRYPNYKDKEDYVIRLSSMPFVKKINVRLGTHLPEKTLFDLYKKKFDIIHGHSGGTISLVGLEVATLKRIPFVFTHHTLLTHYTHYFFKGLVVRPKMMEMVTRIFCNRCNLVIAPSEKIKNEIGLYGVKRPIVVLPTGINPEEFTGIKSGFLKNKLNLKSNKRILLTVGRLGKEKSIDLLVRAFKLASDHDENLIFVIVGDGPEKKTLRSLGKKLGINDRIYFLGNINAKDMPKIYKDADVFLFASTTETQGLVILEAMASRVPVIAVADPAVEEIIKDKINGIISSENLEEFGAKLQDLLEDKGYREKLVREGIRTVDRFSLSKIVDKLEDIYKSLIAK